MAEVLSQSLRTYQGLPGRQVQIEIFDPGCIGICVTG